MTGKEATDTKEPLVFFPDFASWRDRVEGKLTLAELEGTTPAEKQLLKTMVELYRTGAIIAIEDYSRGCSYPQDKIRQILKKHQPKISTAKGNSETFVFACYGASHDSDAFMDVHNITRTFRKDSLEQIANYIENIAKDLPNSSAFTEKDASGGIKFGFTLSNQAAQAMHKINIAMNSVCRGAGD